MFTIQQDMTPANNLYSFIKCIARYFIEQYNKTSVSLKTDGCWLEGTE